MTRTARSTFPRALIRDRSESKSGLDKSLRKGGGGHHNWGSIADEGYLEAAALEDEQGLAAEEDRKESLDKDPSEGRSNSLTEEEKRLARNFRKTALKGQDIDLSAIARTSGAVSTSPTARIAVPVV
ncbi:hypothetical protein J3R82DRAFT_8111 [Butyriboletus roseoflavus]|nr:hypothetical protein J3R82DRAFT_8111 [Butyriboletus roseoflavus]